MTRYLATINVPGYLPMNDEPAIFDTAREAWQYLASEVERSWDDYPEDANGACLEAHTAMHAIDQDAPGTVYAPTPGHDSDHDLGLAYSVTVAEESRVFVLWHGGANYRPSSIYDGDLEVFDSIEDARDALVSRARIGHRHAQSFTYADGRTDHALTPGADCDAYMDVFNYDPRDVAEDDGDPYPDVRLVLAEDGETVTEEF